MAHFTQLNLGSKQSEKSATTPSKRAMMMEEKAVLFGALVIICLTSGAVLLTTQGCSRASDQPAVAANQMPQSPASTQSSPAASAPVAPAVDAKKKAKRPAIVTYKDTRSGLSFQYPRKYTIKTGNSAKEELAGLGPVPMNFAAAGGKTLATIEVNDTFYPGTDLKTAFVNVSVNPALSAEKCSEFSVPVPVSEKTIPASSVTVGENQFMFAEDFDEMNADQPIARYYHKYENATCYEFALGIATDRNDTKEEVRAIDRDAVFEKLEKIVASAQIQSKDEVKPAANVEVGQTTQSETVKTESAKTESSQTEDNDNR